MENIQRENADILSEVFARAAQTIIPPQPVSGIAYRNTDVTNDAIAGGQRYNSVADSAFLNQLLYLLSNQLLASGQFGIQPWISVQAYKQGGLCIGPDGSIWQAQVDIVAGDTTIPGTDTSKWDAPVNIITPAKLASAISEIDLSGKLDVSAAFGMGQTWQDMAGQRAINTTYTNTTGRAIFVCVFTSQTTNTAGFAYVDDVQIVQTAGVSTGFIGANMAFVVPAGSTYRIVVQQLNRWAELR